jgi:hypothetical protein
MINDPIISSKLETAIQLKAYWETLVGKHTPSDRQFLIWQLQYDRPTIERGINRVAIWYFKEANRRQSTIEAEELVRYSSAVMKAVKQEREA